MEAAFLEAPPPPKSALMQSISLLESYADQSLISEDDFGAMVALFQRNSLMADLILGMGSEARRVNWIKKQLADAAAAEIKSVADWWSKHGANQEPAGDAGI